jgi:hypothetical protein
MTNSNIYVKTTGIITAISAVVYILSEVNNSMKDTPKSKVTYINHKKGGTRKNKLR